MIPLHVIISDPVANPARPLAFETFNRFRKNRVRMIEPEQAG
jgi:hypothetical protein